MALGKQRLETPEPVTGECAPLHTHQVVYDLLRSRVKMGCVLDVPCGSGVFSRRLLDSNLYRVAALDLERHPAVPNVDFRAGDMNDRLPFPNNCFDAVVSIEGVEHLQQPFSFVRECNRVLRPGGLLIVTTPNISSLRSRWRWFLTGFHSKCILPLDEQNPLPRHHIRMLSFPELRYMLHTSGFRIERISTNRSKPINWLYGTLLPLQFSFSLLALRHAAKNEEHRQQIVETLRQMMSVPVLFGESMIIVATEVMKSATVRQTCKAPLARQPDLGDVLWGEPSCQIRCPAAHRR